jgi:hypothetical protein
MTGLTTKGLPMPNTLDEWRYLAGVYGESMIKHREQLGQLRHKVNTLEQKLEASEKKRKGKEIYQIASGINYARTAMNADAVKAGLLKLDKYFRGEKDGD